MESWSGGCVSLATSILFLHRTAVRRAYIPPNFASDDHAESGVCAVGDGCASHCLQLDVVAIRIPIFSAACH